MLNNWGMMNYIYKWKSSKVSSVNSRKGCGYHTKRLQENDMKNYMSLE